MASFKIMHVEAGRHLYGGARQVVYLTRGLQQRGVDNVLVCPTGSAIAQQLAGHVEQIRAIPMHGDLDIPLIFRLRRLIHEEKPDILHLHSRRGPEILGGIAGRWAGVPTVYSRRVDNYESPWLARYKYRLYDRVVTISNGIRDVLLASGVDASLIRVARSAIEYPPAERASREEFGARFDIPADAFVIGVIAQLIERKGHRVLLRALPELVAMHPNLCVLCFGQGPLQAALMEEIRNAGMQRHMRLVGFVNDLWRWLNGLDLVVHPAYTEGLGVALLQASAAGLPIIASRAGGMPEAVRDGVNGLLVPPGDDEALKTAIDTLIRDPTQRRALGSAGPGLMAREFSVDAMVESNLAVYRELLADKGA